MNFDGDLYSQNLELEFHKYLREEQKFNSIQELKKQLEEDQKEVLNYFNHL